MTILKTRLVVNNRVAFDNGHGNWAHVPLYVQPLTLILGQTLVVIGRYVLSNRPSLYQDYVGFPHPYFEAGGLWLSNYDPSALADVPLDWSTGLFLDEPSGDDGFLGAGTDTSPMHPYTTGIRTAMHQVTESGPRWISLLAWCASSYAKPGDTLINEPSQGSLSVLVL